MKSPYVKDLEPGKAVTTSFLVQSKEIREKKTGEPYLSLLLSDRTGKIDAKMWDNVAEALDGFDRDDFVKIKAMPQIHLNRPQLTIHKIRKMEDAEVDFADYFPAAERPPDAMWAELRQIVEGIGNTHLRGLLTALLDDEDVARRYRIAPAAKSIHHAFLSGLIEHVLSLCSLCKATAAHYGNIDLDLLLTGAVLHDIGKIYELSYERGFGYTTEGQLLGHMMIALRMVGDKLRGLPDFPIELRNLVEHMIISHHGQLDFGSPKVPQFPEALLLHYLDDLDSKMECMRALIDGDRQSQNDFTTYHTALERVVLKKLKYLAGPGAIAIAPSLTKAEPPSAAPGAVVEPPPAPSISPFAGKLQQALQPK